MVPQEQHCIITSQTVNSVHFLFPVGRFLMQNFLIHLKILLCLFAVINWTEDIPINIIKNVVLEFHPFHPPCSIRAHQVNVWGLQNSIYPDSAQFPSVLEISQNLEIYYSSIGRRLRDDYWLKIQIYFWLFNKLSWLNDSKMPRSKIYKGWK